MEQRERIRDGAELFRAAVEDFLANLWTAIPGIVQAQPGGNGISAKQTCIVQPSISIPVRQQNGTFVQTQLPLLLDVPVIFPSGGGFMATFPLQPGDEVLVIFSCRCIDQWWQNGGVQVQAEHRLHDLSDGFAIPGPRSVPNVPSSISTTTVRLSKNDSSAYIEITAAGVVNIVAPGGVNVTGALGATGEVTAKVGAGNHTVSQHVHGGVTPGSGSTGLPTG